MRAFASLILITCVLSSRGMGLPSKAEGADQVIPPTERARAMLGMARALMTANPSDALERTDAAITLAERSGDTELLLEAVRLKRDLERDAHADQRSLASALRAVELGRGLEDIRIRIGDLVMLGEAYQRTGAHEFAVEAFREGLALARPHGDAALAGKCINGVLVSLGRAGRQNEVLAACREALEYHTGLADELGEALVRLAQGEALTALQRHGDALPHLVKAERLYRGSGQASGLYKALCAKARALAGMRHWPMAGTALLQADSIAVQDATMLTDPERHRLWSLVLEGEGKPGEALRMERRHALLLDSIQKARLCGREVAMQVLYSTRLHEKELKDLRISHAGQQELIQRARIRGRWWLAAFTTLLALLAAALWSWHGYRNALRRSAMRAEVLRRQREEVNTKTLELERQNLRLAERLMQEEAKETLQKELHLRVRDDLQFVITLLRMQGERLKDGLPRDILSDCEGRIRSIALVHEHFHRCGDLQRLNVRAHLLALCEGLLRQQGLQGKVTLDLRVEQDLARSDDLIPLSLLINELLMNAVRQVFTDSGQGTITIALKRLADDQHELTFSADGPDPRPVLFIGNEGFGRDVLRMLADQLHGRIRLLKGDHTTVQLTFTPEEHRLRKAS
jgi:two-component sensor histidine kinase